MTEDTVETVELTSPGRWEFAANLPIHHEECGQCGEVAAPGPCSSCSAEVPEAEELAPEHAHRVQVLAPIRKESAELRVPTGVWGSISVTPGQYVQVAHDCGILEMLDQISRVHEDTDQIEFDDASAVGNSLRRALSLRLGLFDSLHERYGEFLRYEPGPQSVHLYDLIVELVEMTTAAFKLYVELFSAPTVGELILARDNLQELIEMIPYDATIDELNAWEADDPNSAIQHVIGEEGNFVSEGGSLDLPSVFGAFTGQAEPLEAMGARARPYFDYLIGTQEIEAVNASLLLVPAVRVGFLDRPFHAHKTSWLIYDLLELANAKSPDAVATLLNEQTDGTAIYESGKRVESSLSLITSMEHAETSDDRAYLSLTLGVYREVIESTLRPIGWLVHRLDRVLRGQDPLIEADAPTIGDLNARLLGSKSEHPASMWLGSSSDADLRNTESHAQYRYDRELGQMVDIKTSQEWSIDEISELIFKVNSAANGAQAGIDCFIASRDVVINGASWMRFDSHAEAATEFVGLMFRARGFTVSEVARDGRIRLGETSEASPDRLVASSLTAFELLDRNVDILVQGPNDEVLLDVSADSLNQAISAQKSVGELAVPLPLLDNAVRQGRSQPDAIREVLAIQLLSLFVTTMNELEEARSGEWPPLNVLRQAEGRLKFLSDLATINGCVSHQRNRKILRRIERTRLASESARVTGDMSGFLDRLLGLFRWAHKEDAPWPMQ